MDGLVMEVMEMSGMGAEVTGRVWRVRRYAEVTEMVWRVWRYAEVTET